MFKLLLFKQNFNLSLYKIIELNYNHKQTKDIQMEKNSGDLAAQILVPILGIV